MADQKTQKKWVYLVQEGSGDMRALLGGKGAGLAEMLQVQLPVPPGFTITTEACNTYYELGEEFPLGLWDQILVAMKDVERQTGKTFGDSENPLLVSVRSGAAVSMPGMMDTVLNIGLTEQTLRGLLRSPGGERFAYDAYRRFLQLFGKIVLNIPGDSFERMLHIYKEKIGAVGDSDLTATDWKKVTEEFQALIKQSTGKELHQEPYEQLRLAIEAVLASWNGRRAVDYRNFYGIPHDLGTAVNVIAMVFGNMDEKSSSGVAFSRNPATGEKSLYGEYLVNAQGEDVVAGVRTPEKIAHMARTVPELYSQLKDFAERLEIHYRDAQDMEFTVEQGVLYMLQTRAAKRTPQAAVKIAVDMAEEGLITRYEALQRVEPEQINHLLLPRFDAEAKVRAIAQGGLLATGLNASPGAASGKAVFDPGRAADLAGMGENIILVRTETNPDDVHGMLGAKGVLTARGGATSHAAVVARGLGKPCVAGCEALVVKPEEAICMIGGRVIQEQEEISIDGTTGEVFIGLMPTREATFREQHDLDTLLKWADEVKRLGVWANADTPEDAQRALGYGAEGIGLCRTEHMFFDEDRLPIVRKMILAAPEATDLEDQLQRLSRELDVAPPDWKHELERRLAEQQVAVDESTVVSEYRQALDRLLTFQTQDFKAILKVMTGKPVIIRLLDPPMHEFLPPYETLLLEVAELRHNNPKSDALKDKEHLLGLVESLRESNPMLGLRGCRLGLLYAPINQMQARAILTAACDLAKEGLDPRPEIMVPLVGDANELRLVREVLDQVAEQVQREKGIRVPYKIGTMIELPRAAITADRIAQYAQFFSFGTNDLTQTTYGYSRDDAESKFLLTYIERGILPENPFQVLDREGVGALLRMGVELGRKHYPDLEMGICGEHGGDPSSIEFCHQVGLNYVSASPFRVPVARLAAAQAALGGVRRAAESLPTPGQGRLPNV